MTAKCLLPAIALTFILAAAASAQLPTATPVPFDQVHLSDSFWAPRIDLNTSVTVPHMFAECEANSRIDNFRKAAGLMSGSFVGPVYNDSDVYKTLEGAAYSLRVRPDPTLEAYCDNLIDLIGQAQWSDGYLDTLYSCPHDPAGRWSNEAGNHETYCAGHFMEAAVAYYQTTGKTKILDIATSLGQCLLNTFGPGKNMHPPGHEEVEIGLVKLYNTTGDARYLDLAKFFIDQRGNAAGHPLYGSYAQDQAPLAQQTAAVGHAVRAGYFYTGVADVAMDSGLSTYTQPLDAIWANEIGAKYYITGGVGATGSIEGFGADYQLPNAAAYCETCAAVACALWNDRMFLIEDDAKYLDVFEHTLYNGLLSGVSLSGNLFFYANPLASAGGYGRSPWFGTPCCPGNIVRFIPQVPGFAYAHKDDTLYVNLFMSSATTVTLPAGVVQIAQQSNYPWDGHIHITLTPAAATSFTLAVRIPCWATGRPIPGDLYAYADADNTSPTLAVNGTTLTLATDRGFARLARQWQPGDTLDLTLPMPVRRVLANPLVAADAGRVTFQRGPIVYCAEAVDNNDRVDNLSLATTATLAAQFAPALLNGVETLTGQAQTVSTTTDRFTTGTVEVTTHALTLIPYYAWSNRGADAMAVWLPSSAALLAPPGPIGRHLTTLLTCDETAGTVAADTSGHGADHSATLYNGPVFAPGGGRRAGALAFNGTNQYAQLPNDVMQGPQMTFAAWVKWNGGNAWQRICDFGSDTTNNMFLTPLSSANTLRLAITIGGSGAEQQLNASSQLPSGQWVHVAFTLGDGGGAMYVNGAPVATNPAMTLTPDDIPATSNYLGRSHYNDPYFNGSLDDLRIYQYAMTPAEVLALYQSYGTPLNHPPAFVADPLTLPAATRGEPYQSTIGATAADPDPGDTLTFTKLLGPAWLTVAPNGTLSGTPTALGWQPVGVRVADPAGDWDLALLQLQVVPAASSRVARGDWVDY